MRLFSGQMKGKIEQAVLSCFVTVCGLAFFCVGTALADDGCNRIPDAAASSALESAEGWADHVGVHDTVGTIPWRLTNISPPH